MIQGTVVKKEGWLKTKEYTIQVHNQPEKITFRANESLINLSEGDKVSIDIKKSGGGSD